jgi:hypothetical protein
MKKIAAFVLLAFICHNPKAWAQDSKGFVITAIVVDGDTVLMHNLPQIIIKDRRTFKSRRHAVRYNRLVRNVKKVYPYSRRATDLLARYSDTLAQIDNPRERKKIMKKAEKELWDRYGDELKRMTMTQGLILIKLIDRQTGSTSYELVHELRGGFTAFIFQSIARFFHLNLKKQYNESGEDQKIEDIVLLIEQGDI